MEAAAAVFQAYAETELRGIGPNYLSEVISPFLVRFICNGHTVSFDAHKVHHTVGSYTPPLILSVLNYDVSMVYSCRSLSK